jgi:LacI family transcriptional regulator
MTRDGSVQGRRSPVRLRDVAQRAGVDVSVVSRVVNGDPTLRIAETTRLRVEEALRELSYRPNYQARGLRLARTWTIGFVLPDLMNPFYAPIVEGVGQRASEDGYVVVIVRELDRAVHDGRELTFERLLHQERVDGLLIASGRVDDGVLRALAAKDRPLVIVNRRVPGVTGYVIVDDEAGAYVATQHLLEFGHRRLGHVAGPPGIDNTERRVAGFHRAVRESGAEGIVVHGAGWDPDSGYQAARRLLDDTGVTAIFATNIVVAAGVTGFAQERGVAVPRDLSVVALHDFPLAQYLRPALSTVVLPLEELGRAAVDEFVRRLAGEPAREIVVGADPRLLVRESTAPLRQRAARR